jgi:undecaprenyl diphosphate synthase
MIERAERSKAQRSQPRHVAIVMDGNRRWAALRGIPAIEGHRAGARRLHDVVRGASEMGLEVLTVFAFSEENWQRAPAEVALLMELLRMFAAAECDGLVRRNVRVAVLGRLEALPAPTREALLGLCAATAGCDGLRLNLAINYGARAELCDAIRALARDVKAGRIRPDAIDDSSIAGYLYTAGLPDPDLLIRTGGELRLSNFLLYQVAYTELWSTPVNWPDFDEELFAQALGAFAARQRRFGT